MTGKIAALDKYMALCYTIAVKRTTIWVSEWDRKCIETIRKRYGLSTDSDAFRLAIRVLAHSKHLEIEALDSWLQEDDRQDG